MKIHLAFSLQLAASAIPSLILLAVVPLIRGRLELDAFAGFAVIVSAISLLSVLDGGLGRAATYFVSVAGVRSGAFRSRAALLGALAVGAGFAVVGMATGVLALEFLDGTAFVVARDALFVLLMFYPAIVAGSILKGGVEGQQRFALSAGLQLTHGVVIGIAPLFVIWCAADLAVYAWLVGVARVGLVLALLSATGLTVARIRRLARVLGSHVGRLFHYSKWLLFSNLVGLAIIFADRFAIVGFFDSLVVAAYVLPMELVARGQILVGAFSSVAFPKLVRHIRRDSRQLAALIGDSQGVVMTTVLALGFASLPLLEPMMGWWLGHALAQQAAMVALAGIVGLALVSGASITMLAIHGLGHTRQVAALHAFELPLYFGLLVLAIAHASLPMLLTVWLARLAFDLLGMEGILFALLRKGRGQASPDFRPAVLRGMLLMILAGSLLLLAYLKPSAGSLPYWAAAGALVCVLALGGFWFRLRHALPASSASPCPAP